MCFALVRAVGILLFARAQFSLGVSPQRVYLAPGRCWPLSFLLAFVLVSFSTFECGKLCRNQLSLRRWKRTAKKFKLSTYQPHILIPGFLGRGHCNISSWIRLSISKGMRGQRLRDKQLMIRPPPPLPCFPWFLGSAGFTSRSPSGAGLQEAHLCERNAAERSIGRTPYSERLRPAAVPLGQEGIPGMKRLSLVGLTVHSNLTPKTRKQRGA